MLHLLSVVEENDTFSYKNKIRNLVYEYFRLVSKIRCNLLIKVNRPLSLKAHLHGAMHRAIVRQIDLKRPDRTV